MFEIEERHPCTLPMIKEIKKIRLMSVKEVHAMIIEA